MGDTPDYNLEGLAKASGVATRTIRYYIDLGLLPKPPFHSHNTRYGQEHLMRLQAIKRLRNQKLRLNAIAARLAKVTPDELLRLAGMEPPAPPAPKARELPEGFLGPYRPAFTQPTERWERISICPGVDLMVRSEADAEAWRVASEIARLFGTKG